MHVGGNAALVRTSAARACSMLWGSLPHSCCTLNACRQSATLPTTCEKFSPRTLLMMAAGNLVCTNLCYSCARPPFVLTELECLSASCMVLEVLCCLWHLIICNTAHLLHLLPLARLLACKSELCPPSVSGNLM